MVSSSLKTPSYPPVQRRRTQRDLARAEWLRPRDVFEIYGIHPSTLCRLCTRAEEAHRLPSRLIKGRSGTRGLRLINRVELESWLERQGQEAAA